MASSAASEGVLGDGHPEPEISIQTLFGPLFSLSDDSKNDLDMEPSFADPHALLESLFGGYVSESHIQEKNDNLKDYFEINLAAVEMEQVEAYFGKSGAKAFEGQPIESFSILNSTVPTKVELPKSDDSWLVEMPKIQPNRQTVHANPQPFMGKCPYLPSNPRMLFTPSNVMRWGFHCGSNAFMSNARVIRWSDGSVTLHIGEDIYALNDWSSNAEVHLLGSETVITGNGYNIPAFTAKKIVRRHFVMDSTEAISVQKAVADENTMNSDENRKRKLGYTTNTLPPINWEKPSKDRNIFEEFVVKEYERRSKEIIQRRKEGKPMTLSEQIMMEEELNKILQAANEGRVDLEEENKSTARDAFITQRQSRQKRNKFDRNLALEGEWVHDPLAEDDDESNSDSEDIQDLMHNWEKVREEEESHRQAKRAKVESSVSPLSEVLEDVLKELPSESDPYAAVSGVLELLQSASSPAIVEEEVLAITDLIEKDLPHVDISALKRVAKEVF